MEKSIVIIAGQGETTNILYNALRHNFQIAKIIKEEPVPAKVFLGKRLKRLGLFKVLGQILFRIFIIIPLKLKSKNRIMKIHRDNDFDASEPPAVEVMSVASANSAAVKEILETINPSIVVIHGTRIIAKEILNCIAGKFINIHAGITPAYRGSHGAYWALANDDKENCGVTVHLLDEGIDTGGVLYQEKIVVTNEDNFVTYPWLQLAKGLPLLVRAINDVMSDTYAVKDIKDKKSGLWSHPTLFEYLSNRIFKKIK